MSAYTDQLKDPRWQRKRLEILEARGWKCEDCGETAKELHVHHPIYLKGYLPWEYPDWMYIVLCGRCHNDRHEMQTSLLLWFGQIRGRSKVRNIMGIMLNAVWLVFGGALWQMNSGKWQDELCGVCDENPDD